MKLKWDCLERNKWKKYDFILDFICENHCDFLLIENFRQNFSKLVVWKTLVKVCQYHEEEIKLGLIQRKEKLQNMD